MLDQGNMRAFYRQLKARGDYITLDNSVTEVGEAADIGKLATYAASIRADEIVLPDIFDDAAATVKSTLDASKAFYNLITRSTDTKLVGVVHGRTLDEWSWCYEVFSNDSRIDVLGLPKVMSKNFENRTQFLQKYFEIHARSDKPHHLLGVWEQPYEVSLINYRLPWIRSIDTSLPVMAGIAGYVFGDQDYKKVQLDESLEIDPHPDKTVLNISTLLAWTQHRQGYEGDWQHGESTAR
jgi:hypothetical protein